DRAPRPGSVTGLDHVEHRQPSDRPAGAARPPAAPAAAAGRRPAGPARPADQAVRDRRLARVPARRQAAARHPLSQPGTTGAARQLAAIVTCANRARSLRWVRTPTVVIHGTADKLVRPSGGRATARAIPGAELVLIKGMGHDLPEGAWPQVIGAIVRNARGA